MRRFAMAAAVASLALGSALVMPVAAQAQTLPTPPQPPVPGPPQRFGQWEFFTTYASQGDCNTVGQELHNAVPLQNQRFMCEYGYPTAGTYNLWVYFINQSNL